MQKFAITKIVVPSCYCLSMSFVALCPGRKGDWIRIAATYDLWGVELLHAQHGWVKICGTVLSIISTVIITTNIGTVVSISSTSVMAVTVGCFLITSTFPLLLLQLLGDICLWLFVLT